MGLHWRKMPSEGMRSSGERHELRDDGKQVMVAAEQPRTGGWYWYGMGMNTAATPAPTLAAAKEQAKAFYLTNKPEPENVLRKSLDILANLEPTPPPAREEDPLLQSVRKAGRLQGLAIAKKILDQLARPPGGGMHYAMGWGGALTQARMQIERAEAEDA